MRKMYFPFTKRRKILFVSALLTGILWVLQQTGLHPLLGGVILAAICYVLTYWVLDFDLEGQEYIALPILVVIFAVIMELLLPILRFVDVYWATFPIFFGGLYLLFLTTNILNISTVRPLPLLRAAWTALQLVYFGLSFTSFVILFWYELPLMQTMALSFILPFILSYPAYYLVINELGRGGHPFFYMFFTGLIAMEFSGVLIILNLPFYLKALGMGIVFYIVTGILEHDLKTTLNKKMITEYLFISLLFLGLISYLIIFT